MTRMLNCFKHFNYFNVANHGPQTEEKHPKIHYFTCNKCRIYESLTC